MSYTQNTGMRSTRFPLSGCGCGGGGVSGLGQAATATASTPTPLLSGRNALIALLSIGVASAIFMPSRNVRRNRRRRH